MDININILISTALDAGQAILNIYNSGQFDVELKSDQSPLTKADVASHEIIKKGLNRSYPHIPLLSEEGKEIPFETRKEWSKFWLVDPLDGTKEFIKKNGEFTVNIALIKNNKPVLGVIYAPVLNILYYGQVGVGAFKRENEGATSRIQVNDTFEDGLTAVKSRSHSTSSEEDFLSSFSIKNTISIGSSLKFCMVAEGKAHMYYRNGPTWEWDTAAGQAIVESAGGFVSVNNGKPLSYNKKIIKNDSFFVSCGIKKEYEQGVK